jgi:hypothetical protein
MRLASKRQGKSMWYVLTIVLISGVTIVSTHSSKESCEALAEQARARATGTQAVQVARCEPVPPGSGLQPATR